MPSFTHEIILELFRNRPELAPVLLRDALHVELPQYTRAEIVEATLTDIQPAEYRADLVVLLHQGVPVFGIVVEAQLQKDPEKLYSWPTYATLLRSRHRCPVCVLVFAGDESVAEWARQSIELGSGNRFHVWVISPEGVPVVTDAQQAALDPELAVLSVMAHGTAADYNVAVRIALAAQFASVGLDADRSRMYGDLIFNSLTDAARNALMNMNPARYEYQSEFARRYVAEGLQKGIEQGIERGIEQGLERGHVEGRAALLIRMLARRFGNVPDALQARIRAASIDDLDAIGDRVLTASTIDEALGER